MTPTKLFAFVLFGLLALGTANGARITRQASRCNGGIPCVPLNDCEPMRRLLRNPTPQNLFTVREALCDRSRRSPKVCCETGTTPTPTPVVTAPTRPPPTGPTNPGAGEALLPPTCGKGTSDTRIFNGVDVPLGSYPWMAILGYRGSDPQGSVEWGCGGALINNRYVVTAAHCVLPDLPIVEIRLGEHNLNTTPDCIEGTNTCAPPHQSFRVTRAQITSHASYDTRAPISDDIALIRLDRPATFNNFVQPICLPEAELNVRSFLSGREALVAGWGRTEQGSTSHIMKQVQIPLVNLQTCQPIYLNQLLPEQICFGGDSGRDTCNGDSGGPVFHADRTGVKYHLIGVVSFGKQCGGEPAIYTNVASYRSWILQNLRP